jgi:hypothetical protein
LRSPLLKDRAKSILSCSPAGAAYGGDGVSPEGASLAEDEDRADALLVPSASSTITGEVRAACFAAAVRSRCSSAAARAR